MKNVIHYKLELLRNETFVLIRKYILFLLLISLSPSLLSESNIKIYHNHSNIFYKTAISPDSKHFAASDGSRVRIWEINGDIVGEFFEKNPRIATRKEWKFWNIYRSTTPVIAFVNNEELAIVQDEGYSKRKIIITGLDGVYKREYILPGKKINEMGTHEDKKHGRQSGISAIHVSPDGETIITFEPYGYYIFIRDKNFKEIKGIRLDPTAESVGRFAEIKNLKFLPDSSGFIIETNGEAVKDGWISTMTLYDIKGNQIRGLLTDKLATSIDSPYGKIPTDPIYAPKEWDISPDGKYIAWIDRNPKIDKKLLGTYKVEEIHPKGSFKEKPHGVYIGIRRIEIATGKHHLAIVVNGGDTTLKNVEERRPYTDPYIKDLYFDEDSEEYIGSSQKGIYRISLDGKITSWKENSEDTEFTEYYKRKYGKSYSQPILLDHTWITPDRKTLISKNFYFLSIDGDLKGQIGNKKSVLESLRGYEPLRVSHEGRFITLEFDRGKDSLLWDTKTSEITRVNASVFWDTENREYRMSKSNSSILIKYNNSEMVLPSRYLPLKVFPFPDGTAALSETGLVMLDKEGNASKKHPRSTYWAPFAMHPSLKYYLVPNVDPKVKTMVKVDITGKKLSEFWIGSFFTNVRYSPDGTHIIGSHSESGCISIWDESGNLQDFPGMQDKRFLDLHPEHASGIAMTKDNQFLITSTNDAIYLVNLKSGKRAKASIFYKNNEEKDTEFDFIVSDSEGRFEASEAVKHLVGISENGQNKSEKLRKKQFTSGLLWKFLSE